jgi:hypothetical protein
MKVKSPGRRLEGAAPESLPCERRVTACRLRRNRPHTSAVDAEAGVGVGGVAFDGRPAPEAREAFGGQGSAAVDVRSEAKELRDTLDVLLSW